MPLRKIITIKKRMETAMIIDRFENVSQYECVHPRFPAAVAYLKSLLEKNVPDGKYEPEGSASPAEFYVSIATGALKTDDTARAESHRKYIDLQLVLDGVEKMYIPSLEPIPAAETEYSDEKDCMHYERVSKDACHCLLVPEGQFAIFLAEELHAPSMAPGNEATVVRKAVLKILA